MNPIKVLIADDSPVAVDIIETILDADPEITVIGRASNGRDAIEKVSALRPDVITIDINMPVMNGLEFLQRVQKEQAYQGIPVIIISTEGKEEDTIRGLKMGAKGYVKKPFQASELHGLIEKITAAQAG